MAVGHVFQVLLKADDLRLVLIAMENGAIMKEHAANGTVAIHAFEGSLCVHTQDQAYDLNEGKVLTLAPRMKHDVEAREDCAFLLTIACRLRTSWPATGSGSDSKTVKFSSLLGEHRRQFSRAAAGHADPLDAVRTLHNNLSSLNTKADVELKFLVVFTEEPVHFARRKHFLCSHQVIPP